MAAILVPPPILQEVKAVLHPPVVADVPQEVGGGDAVGIETRREVPHVVRDDFAVEGANFTIDAQRYTATSKIERFANVVGVLQVDPQPAGFFESPLL